MSKSRLEKFLYALYSLDSSDLPAPLSRIEELYKCLVTSEEAPTFEPISRVEKYLMAILGGYDVDSLPNPLSRVEVLLYKLATGDDNLDDVKSFLSEHEELLAEIIRNGGVGGNIDIEYVLYTLSTESNTLYNTAEKPVKSAILRGNTLVNIIKNPSEIKVVGKGASTLAKYEVNYLDNTKNYTVLFKISDYVGSGNITVSLGTSSKGLTQEVNKNGIYKFLIPSNKIGSEMNEIWIYWTASNWTDGNSANVSDIVLIEGDYTEGMPSVKMPVLTTTGKNLFDTNAVPRMGSEYNDFKKAFATTIKPILILKPNTTYQINGEITQMPNRNSVFKFVDNNGVEIQGTYVSMNNTNGSEPKKIKVNNKFTTGNNGEIYFNTFPAYAQEDLDKLKDILNSSKIQIEEGVQATSYEPYKSNILTVNEPVELRKVGNIQDELNLLTGELTKRIGEIVLDGSEGWTWYKETTNTIIVYTTNPLPNHLGAKYTNSQMVTNYLDIVGSIESDKDGCYISNTGKLNLAISKTKVTSVNEFKQYLQSTPLVVQYLQTESVKTVDLSVVDQDGNNTKLSTFDDITHVTLSSEGLIPEAELEVATKNEEVLNTMSLEMDDISTTQTTLEETSNTQSENVDATMIATTEIYEGLL